MKLNIRTFLLPGLWVCLGLSCTKTIVQQPGAGTPLQQTLESTLESSYSYSLFVYALKKTGLEQAISGNTAYTLLVPDNDAFARDSILSDSDLDKLDTAYLRQWIGYHIVNGAITVASVAQAVNNPYQSITGQTLYFSRPIPGTDQTQPTTGGILHINGDTVNTADIQTSNGVIQVLNTPLKLPASSVQAYLSANAQYSVFVAALQRFGLWNELTGPGPFTVFAPNNASFSQFNITPDSVNNLDTTKFQTALFGIYVLSDTRIFLTDFADIGSTGNFYTSNGEYSWVGGTLDDAIPYSNVLPVIWTDENTIAVNGVVQGMDGILLLPSEEKK